MKKEKVTNKCQICGKRYKLGYYPSDTRLKICFTCECNESIKRIFSDVLKSREPQKKK